jgi:pimeloyl-ACP methyl ester carboxylesterase
MPQKSIPNPADYIVPLNINGLEGRMLRMPAPKKYKREILFIYGHHSSLERWWGVMLNLNRYGAVTMPDLPGFGGMDSFYKVHKDASIDNFADYLATFVKLRYKNKRVMIVGMSLGFVMVTRMLQKYPELCDKVELLVSYVGFSHYQDFSFSKVRWAFYRYTAGFFSHRLPAIFFRYVCLSPIILKTVYRHTYNAREKFHGLVAEEINEITKFEIRLWHDNDVRTYMKTTTEFLTLDNCKVKVNLPVQHIAVAADRYFDNNVVEQHLRVIFSDFTLLTTIKVGNHAPSIIADEKAAAPFMPPKLRSILSKQ